ncbi:TIR-NBS-LRR RCT1 resistance protein, partial [Trifolium medium]|nr:TIR-NBS-LRR RCT1 resistance protein [Trifolium medium]
MDERESLELLSWHAFKQPSPIEDFATHSTDVIAYSGRLPLALQVLGFFADIGIKVLVERSLVTVDNRNKLRMHDMLRDMGRQIIYDESPFDAERRSRLWRREEVFDILSKNK